ncbi:MAG: hypothetical protein K8R63_12710 [Bacteroidales bacterium]|nr:hypothetical protein [Bacteroidales bacterium]
MRKIIYILFVFVLTGCVTPNTLLSPEERADIPKGANKVIVQSDKQGGDLFDHVYSTLITDGFRIDESNEEQGYISTQGKEIDQETMLRLSVVIMDSTATFIGQWDVTASMKAGLSAGFGATGSGWSDATWGDAGRPSLAFAYMFKYAERIGTVTTEK